MHIVANLQSLQIGCMKIAVIGAGRIGSAFAFRLARAGYDVTVVARGTRLDFLREQQGIVSVTGQRAPVEVAAELDVNVAYDLVLVTVLAHQAKALLPTLRASAATTVMLMFNTFEPLAPWREAIGTERAVFAFPNMMAFLVQGRLKSIVDKPGMVTVLSCERWVTEFERAGFPTAYEPDMQSYYRSHVAFYVPTLVAALLVWQRSSELTWGEARELTLALREGLRLVERLGHTLAPKALKVVSHLPTVMTTALLWAFARTHAVKDLGEFGPTEARALIDAMVVFAPEPPRHLIAIRP